jgi:GDP-L-fucose synthase
MNTYNSSDIVNIGTGEDISLKELALLIKDIVGFDGNILFDESKPDGTPRKLLDVSKLKELGWIYKTNLREGIEKLIKIMLNKKIAFFNGYYRTRWFLSC